jgi:hypothetical protein
MPQSETIVGIIYVTVHFFAIQIEAQRMIKTAVVTGRLNYSSRLKVLLLIMVLYDNCRHGPPRYVTILSRVLNYNVFSNNVHVVVNERGFSLRLRQVLDDTLSTIQQAKRGLCQRTVTGVSVLCVVPINGTLRITGVLRVCCGVCCCVGLCCSVCCGVCCGVCSGRNTRNDAKKQHLISHLLCRGV